MKEIDVSVKQHIVRRWLSTILVVMIFRFADMIISSLNHKGRLRRYASVMIEGLESDKTFAELLEEYWAYLKRRGLLKKNLGTLIQKIDQGQSGSQMLEEYINKKKKKNKKRRHEIQE
ncbi:MAG: hypothetical protein LWX55_00810 [Deltaproteobacteria bacterium]|jgi:hypothetical protein|nr:hypothetical protein [Deltaproteobacteria bacterium]